MTDPSGAARLILELEQAPRHDPRDDRVRLAVQLRARDACEYCLMPTMGRFEIDHVVPPALWDAHLADSLPVSLRGSVTRGPEHLDNFAWSCPFCNRAKSQQVATRVGRRLVRLFNPRQDHWPEHFLLVRYYLFVEPLTDIGRATEKALRFNEPRLFGPLAVRHILIVNHEYPPPFARGWADR